MRSVFAILAVGGLAAALGSAGTPTTPDDPSARHAQPRTRHPLPVLGTTLSDFPPGDEKAIADAGCLQCHSADIPRQQRLTEKQWTAEVEKMIRWGASVKETDKPALVAYLVRHFGSSNEDFVAPETAPLSPPKASR